MHVWWHREKYGDIARNVNLNWNRVNEKNGRFPKIWFVWFENKLNNVQMRQKDVSLITLSNYNSSTSPLNINDAVIKSRHVAVVNRYPLSMKKVAQLFQYTL
jgi:hypothetical protein